MKSKKQLQRYRAMIGSPARDASRSNSLVFAPGRWAWNAIAGHPATSIAGWERLCKACWSWRRREGGMRIFAAWKLRTLMYVYDCLCMETWDVPWFTRQKKVTKVLVGQWKTETHTLRRHQTLKIPGLMMHFPIETSIETGIFRVACLWMMSGCLVKSSSQP
jgi:hypothetical protein